MRIAAQAQADRRRRRKARYQRLTGTLHLVNNYVRPGRLQLRFENLSFIGPDSVKAGRVAAAASQQDRPWNFADLLYLNQGQEPDSAAAMPSR